MRSIMVLLFQLRRGSNEGHRYGLRGSNKIAGEIVIYTLVDILNTLPDIQTWYPGLHLRLLLKWKSTLRAVHRGLSIPSVAVF